MDLLATVRKEGARGGRGDFKWSDVQSSTHRENYLGHSLMAPVGRWQKGRDLNWYAKGSDNAADTEEPAAKAERERKEEINRIKEAEQDALARALGFDVAPRNPNLEALGERKEVDKILKEAVEGEKNGEGGTGVGFGAADNEIVVVSDTEGAEAEATTEDVILIGVREGTSTATDAVQGHAKGEDSVTRDLGHVVEKGDETTTMSLRKETTNQIEVVRLEIARTIDGFMTRTSDVSGDD